MMEMKDVPSSVWREVRDKWVHALDNRLYHVLWQKTALCKWVHDNTSDEPRCRECPLRSWCNGSDMSMIHIGYHDYDVDRWAHAVGACIEEISQYCGDDNDGQA